MSKNEFEILINTLTFTTGLSQEEIAKSVKYNDGYISQVKSRDNIPEKFVNLLKEKYKEELQNANLSKPAIGKTEEDSDRQLNRDITIEAILRLISQNEVMAKANADAIKHIGVAVASNKELVEINKQLSGRVLLKDPGNAAPQTSTTFESKYLSLLELIAELSSGQLKFESKKEALAALSSRLYSQDHEPLPVGIQKD